MIASIFTSIPFGNHNRARRINKMSFPFRAFCHGALVHLFSVCFKRFNLESTFPLYVFIFVFKNEIHLFLPFLKTHHNLHRFRRNIRNCQKHPPPAGIFPGGGPDKNSLGGQRGHLLFDLVTVERHGERLTRNWLAGHWELASADDHPTDAKHALSLGFARKRG